MRVRQPQRHERLDVQRARRRRRRLGQLGGDRAGASVFSNDFPKGLDASIIFVTVASEEQGLNGSRQLAEWLHEKGYKVVAGMTDDIVGNVVAEDGYTDSTSMRIFAADPDNSPSRELGRYVWGLNRVYLPNFEVLPVWRLDRIGRGGDHEPYVTLGDRACGSPSASRTTTASTCRPTTSRMSTSGTSRTSRA